MTRFKGEHTRLVTLQKRTVTYNDQNEPEDDWTQNDQEIYAEFWQQHGQEEEEGGQLLATKDVRCKIRYVDGLNEKDYRIKDGSQIYDIESIVERGRRKTQMLMLRIKDND